MILFIFTHDWLSELNWFEHFYSQLTLIYATWLPSISFSNGWTVGFCLWSTLNFVFALDQTKTGITNSIFFICLFVWSKDFKDNQGCQFFNAMTGLDISTVPTWQLLQCMGACKPVRNGIILHVCAYSCHLPKVSIRIWILPDHLPVKLQELLTLFKECEQNEMMAFTPRQLV